MILTLLFPPGGPDLCALAGFCQTTAQAGQPNMLWLASALLLAGVVLQRRGRGQQK
jgi:MYXO-CTERM domain-containing protein